MKKIAVTGTSGFIGKRFLDLYKSQFSEVIKLTRELAPLDNLALLEKNTKDIDIVVHIAFDHYYQFNKIGLDNIIEVCKRNKIQKLVFISSFSVYDPNFIGELTEKSPYSTLLDPYSVEKRNLESKLINQPFDVIILQPCIVYGISGSWSKFAINACKHSKLELPSDGICNAVYIDDVAQSIFKACLVSDIKYDVFLIGAKEPVTWKMFYQAHSNILSDFGYKSNLFISNSNNKYHNNWLFNSIFVLWYKTFLGNIINTFLKQIKSLREKKYSNIPLDFNQLLKMDLNAGSLATIGITRQMHSVNYTVSSQHAEEVLGYKPEFAFQTGIDKMKKEIVND
ncbi:SDR family oxidoreductase [Glaesserella parasuis]|uniref:NAD-dependent epimerase/dehydratase family protein n=2 Tax=Glaesserella parasuis TaxID=738 RepID=UPI00094FCAEB|nr:SDR family oxidoreductase [Glaesserella parasuis]MDG6283771.1 SDR family oxidoreductase [Glaesserella parasuis]MDG6460678.1 SDR family oxidoreductase [Glaesserella parasuis]MDG6468246.1 SDR family oxidoreductase [Glaesserella parasuis]MDG6482258.1 SDR family oxidoreductase [Glaesserella parasuis]MDG6869685.1 SDR family oxidoreductase [Glaesserella parasuis]